MANGYENGRVAKSLESDRVERRCARRDIETDRRHRSMASSPSRHVTSRRPTLRADRRRRLVEIARIRSRPCLRAYDYSRNVGARFRVAANGRMRLFATECRRHVLWRASIFFSNGSVSRTPSPPTTTPTPSPSPSPSVRTFAAASRRLHVPRLALRFFNRRFFGWHWRFVRVRPCCWPASFGLTTRPTLVNGRFAAGSEARSK